jgi:hypothetical protein
MSSCAASPLLQWSVVVGPKEERIVDGGSEQEAGGEGVGRS